MNFIFIDIQKKTGKTERERVRKRERNNFKVNIKTIEPNLHEMYV